MINRKVFLLLVAVSILLLNGCASYPQHEVSNVEAMPDVTKYKNKPTVFIDFRFLRGTPDDENATESSAAKDKLVAIVDEAVNESGLFETVTFDEFEKDKMGYTIRMDYYNYGDEGAAAVSGFLTGFTLGIIPGAATDNYTLKVSIEDKQGKVLAQTNNKDSISTWLGIWFIPVMSNTPEIAINTTLRNQVRSALKQLFEDNKLKYSGVNSFFTGELMVSENSDFTRITY